MWRFPTLSLAISIRSESRIKWITQITRKIKNLEISQLSCSVIKNSDLKSGTLALVIRTKSSFITNLTEMSDFGIYLDIYRQDVNAISMDNLLLIY